MGDINIPRNPEYKPKEFHISLGVLADNLAKKVFGDKDKTKAPKGAEEKKDFKKGIIELEPYEGPLRKFFKKANKATDKGETKEKQDTKITLQENLLRGLLALPVGISIHEFGHASQTNALGCDAFVDPVPKIKGGQLFLGSTTWYGNADNGQQASFNIAGVKTTKLASKTILEYLRSNNKELTPKQKSFWAMLGLFGGTDFTRYTLLGPSSNPGHDITNFSRNTGAGYNTMRGLAGLDLLLNNRQYKYFWDTMWGKNTEPPPESDWDVYFDYKTLPMSGSPGVGSVGIQHRF